MGTWGFSVHENDMFMDVKDFCVDLLEEGLRPFAMEKRVLKEYCEVLEDVDDGPYVHYAIADAEMEAGKLSAAAQNAALQAVEQQKQLLLPDVESDEAVKKIFEGLEAFAQKLQQKKKRRRREKIKCKWNPGDVYRVRLQGKTAELVGIAGRWLIVRVIRLSPEGTERFPNVYLQLAPEGICPETREDIQQAEYLIADWQGQYRFRINAWYNEEFERYEFLGNYPDLEPPLEPVVEHPCNSPILICCMDRRVSDLYLWQTEKKEPPYFEDDIFVYQTPGRVE